MELRRDACRLFVREREGRGVPVVLLHGWALSSFVWQPLFERWLGDERLLAPDLRGTGFSEKPAEGYALPDYGRDVIALLEALPGPAVLVGHSMGGLIAQWVALEAPERLARLVLISPVPAEGVPLPPADREAIRQCLGDAEGSAQLLRSMMAHPPCPNFDALWASMAAVAPHASRAALDTFCDARFGHRLGEIRVPTRVLVGEHEVPLTPALIQAQVADRISGATLEVMPEVAHYPQWEAPDAFVRRLASLVRGA